MLKHIHLEAESGAVGEGVELAITDWARAWAVGTQAALAERVHSELLAPEAAALLAAADQRAARHAARTRSVIGKYVLHVTSRTGPAWEGDIKGLARPGRIKTSVLTTT